MTRVFAAALLFLFLTIIAAVFVSGPEIHAGMIAAPPDIPASNLVT